MKLLYFGADMPWKDLEKEGFRRRNTWLLKTFRESGCFDEVLNFRKVPRNHAFKKFFTRRHEPGIRDVYVTNLFPIQLTGHFFRQLNRIFNRILLFLQGAKKFNSSQNILWSYWPKGFLQARELNLKGRWFFDADHNIIDDPNLDPQRKKFQKNTLIEAGKHCEYVISSARSMLQWYRDQGFRNTYYMRNGIDPQRFNNIPAAKLPFKRPIIGYIGTISKWINYEALGFLIRNHPDWTFLIYGASFKNKLPGHFPVHPNCHFLGPLKPDDVPSTILSFDVALNLYKNKPWLDVDSMKIYEYLAAGIPVVSWEYHPHLKKDFDGLLNLVRNEKELGSEIEKILKNDVKPGKHDAFIRNSTWEIRVKTMYEDIIDT